METIFSARSTSNSATDANRPTSRWLDVNDSASHYEVLGVGSSARTEEIRSAYRRLAREHHPDRHGGRTTPHMIRINEAWRVLSNAERRRRYDEALAQPPTATSAASMHHSATASPPMTTATPARFPWRFVLGFFVLATGAILLIGAFTEPGDTPPIDNIIRVGSCVDVDQQIQEAREVACDGPHDAQVVALVPFDGRCPVETETFRDRQGLGLVCTTE